jgi:hypothetical protein
MKLLKLTLIGALSACTVNGQTVTGSGNNNVLTKWTGGGLSTSVITNSILRDNGTTLSLGNYVGSTPGDYMMHIYESGPFPLTPHKIGLAVELFGRSSAAPVKGLTCNVQNNQENIGIDVYTANGTISNGGHFVSSNATQTNKAVVGAATGGISTYGGQFSANNGTNNYGGSFTATDGVDQNMGVSANGLDYSGLNTGSNYGLSAFGYTESRNENFGIKSLAVGPVMTTSFGIWSEIISTNSGSYAGYFAATNSSNCAYFDGAIVSTSPFLIVSDQKFKKEIQPVENALAKIMALKPSTYLYKSREEFPSFNFPAGRQYGLIAQEAEQAIPEIVRSATNPARYDKEGKKITDAVTFKGVEYGELIPILAAAIQEQQKIIEAQNEKIASLEKGSGTWGSNTSSTGVTPAGNTASEAMLFQNVPNPFNGSTEIGYRITQTYSNAVIMIFDMNGKKIKNLPLQGQEGQITVSATDLSAGMYLYSLILDGREMVTKRMVVNK